MRVLLTIGVFCLGGCGMFVPEKDVLTPDTIPPRQLDPTTGHVEQSRSLEGNIEGKILAHIQCEIAKGLWEAHTLPRVGWIASSSYGTAITLKITADEEGQVNPGVTYTKAFQNMLSVFPYGGNIVTPQSFAIGGGISAAAHATRTETIQFTDQNDQLIEVVKDQDKISHAPFSCAAFQGGLMIQSNLAIDQFIYDKVSIASADIAESTARGDAPFNAMQEELTFVATLGANVTPSWRVLTIATGTSPSLAGATRNKTYDVIISVGKLSLDKNGNLVHPIQLASAAAAVHDSALIGSQTAQDNQAVSH